MGHSATNTNAHVRNGGGWTRRRKIQKKAAEKLLALAGASPLIDVSRGWRAQQGRARRPAPGPASGGDQPSVAIWGS
jgi:hypothetical protein